MRTPTGAEIAEWMSAPDNPIEEAVAYAKRVTATDGEAVAAADILRQFEGTPDAVMRWIAVMLILRLARS